MKAIVILTLTICTTFAKAQQQTSYWMGRTTGKLPHLLYGLGEDRLGGAKMTYLDSNIAICVVDSTKENYKVKLSGYHYAYMPKTAVKRDSLLISKPYHLSQNWNVYGDSLFDYVKIILDEKLPYKSVQQMNPSRIVVDIYGATSNTNWITQLSNVKEIQNTWYEQPEDDVLRAVIELKHDQHWGHHIYYDSASNVLVIRVKRQPYPLTLRNLRIAIDAGHGGSNGGAEGVTSRVLEKTYTLQFAKQLETTLREAGVTNVYMTRTKDTTLSMPERVDGLLQFNPDVLISLHLNSSNSDTMRGVGTFYRYIGFRPLSQALLKQMLSLGLAEYGNVGNFNFALNGPIDYPNALVEIAFLSNKQDEKLIMSPEFRTKVAARIMRGIQNWIAAMEE
ncbi:N-acetylmuramoyl-L-alanine amidase [Filimonas lacunae]|uniref:N-acetylmuramoyl-L-alanine amidase n=1 Tax=Filimonas lacunae TaxID=477680 RepID=A0A173MQY8_9BACT|nr:N-acetylmuramoyl-L-alanine amidase [Filimonas lacunae]BAV09860.1 N-acetylmuramoyl-L-alanine amidase [Filimonas lacunae]SIS80091.1 N-acetylmuramoyl-L-alanine amidase [Filimonas lacunae]